MKRWLSPGSVLFGRWSNAVQRCTAPTTSNEQTAKALSNLDAVVDEEGDLALAPPGSVLFGRWSDAVQLCTTPTTSNEQTAKALSNLDAVVDEEEDLALALAKDTADPLRRMCPPVDDPREWSIRLRKLKYAFPPIKAYG